MLDVRDGTHSTPKYVKEGVPLLTSKNLVNGNIVREPSKLISLEDSFEINKRSKVDKNDILLAMIGTVGNPVLVPELDYDFSVKNVAILKYISELNMEFTYYFIQFHSIELKKNSSGAVQSFVSLKTLRQILFPLPPLAEQKRIVEQIEKALAKVDEYAESYNKLQQLDKEFPDKLKKSILQYAMQGKLVAQNPNDEPVEVLLEKIKAEKQNLFEEGKLKKKDLAEMVVIKGDDNSHYQDVLYDIPKSWEWVKLNNISSYIQRGKSPKYSTIPKYPVIAQKCNQWSGFSIELAKFISPDTVKSYQEERLLRNSDLMWNSTGLGTLGRLAIYDEDKNPYGWAVADSHVTVIRLFLDFISYQFIYQFLASPIVQSVIEEQASGSTKQKELSTTTIKGYPIPLPPLAEQHRIVNKINQVFSVIETLV
ncbi:restriction endonuclease subunit S [Streptococcus thoraltensis]|uniref:restriction endonuclease subunit S n=1 Tax=Streptococcus thoraltensis TaxID=55085 RepID=UPI001F595BD3|nr:restriction endonuclease subunit S [Streptococcus thoraltensis]